MVLMLLAIGLISCSGAQAEDIAQQAFDMRLSGQVEKAKALLDKYLADSPDDAAAYYELARLECYMVNSGRGGMEALNKSVDDAKKAIMRAMEIEPENVIYRYFAGQITFLQSYIGLKSDQGNAKELIGKICKGFESVLELKPDYGEVILHLVELYGGMPEEMGGDKVKAEQYTKQLEEIDIVLGAKARAIMSPQGSSAIRFWQGLSKKLPGNAGILEALGKEYLRQGQTDGGTKHLEEAMKTDPKKDILLLDLARYHVYSMMGDESLKKTAIPIAEEFLNKYLATDPILPIKAYAIGMLGRLKFMSGDETKGLELKAQAEKLDKYFSMASAIPHPDLFAPLDEVSHNHAYLFQPF